MRNFYKAIPFLLWPLSSLKTWEQVTRGDAECPALGRIFLNEPPGTVPRNPLRVSVLWASEILLAQWFAHQNSQGEAATWPGLVLPGPQVRLRQPCKLSMCLFRLHFGHSDYTVYVRPPEPNHSKELRKRFLPAPYMNVIRLLLKIKSRVHSPHGFSHNALAHVHSVPPSLQPSKSSICLCHGPFALRCWNIHRIKSQEEEVGMGPSRSLVLQLLHKELPKKKMEEMKVYQGKGKRTEKKRKTQREWLSSRPLLWELTWPEGHESWISFLGRSGKTTGLGLRPTQGTPVSPTTGYVVLARCLVF